MVQWNEEPVLRFGIGSLMHHQLTPISGVFLSAVAGILIDRILCPGPSIYLIVILVVMSLIPGLRLLRILERQESVVENKRVIRISLVLLVTSFFAIWHYLDWWHEPLDAFRPHLLRPTPVTAIVELEREVRMQSPAPWHPLRRSSRQHRVTAEVRIRAVRQMVGGQWQWVEVSGRGILTCSIDGKEDGVERWSSFSTGGRFLVIGTAIPLETAGNAGGWSPATHYWGNRCGFVLKIPDDPQAVTLIHTSEQWLLRLRDTVRKYARLNLKRLLPDRQFRLASAVLLGDRQRLHTEELEQFANGGIVHLVAISGLHVGILAGGLLLPLRLFSRYQVTLYLAVLTVIWCYAAMVDLRPPVTRAAILVTAAMLGRLCLREFHAVYSLYLAGFVILVMDPSSLFDVGTQLSFIAVATLFLLKSLNSNRRSGVVRLLFRRKTLGFRICILLMQNFRMAILTTAMIVIVTLPLTSSRFHLVSVSGILLNALLAIPITVGILSGFLVAMTGGVPWLCQIPATLSDWAFGFIWKLSDWQSLNVSGTHWMAGPTDAWCFGFYLLLGLAVGVIPFFVKYQKAMRWCLGVWILGSVLLWPQRIGFRSSVDEWRVVFINVEHGTSVLLEIPGGGVWLYDAGSLTDFRIGGRVIADVLWQRGHSRLHGIFLSHADLDHFNAVPFLLPRFYPQQVMVSEHMHQQLFPHRQNRGGLATRHLADCLKDEQTFVEILSARDQLTLGSVSMEVLAPVRNHEYSSDNDASLVLLLNHAESRVLLPGDIEQEGIELLTFNHPRRSHDVVMVPHHGSLHSEPRIFSHWSWPRFAVVSTGHEAISSVVSESYQQVAHQRDGALMLTSLHGMIEFRLGKNGLEPVTQ